MTKIIVTRAFSGVGFSFSPSDEPQEVPEGIAEMAVDAGAVDDIGTPL